MERVRAKLMPGRTGRFVKDEGGVVKDDEKQLLPASAAAAKRAS
jgi:hypothetical protein